ncbi:MAG: hypothetical protein ACRD0C_02890 [Acidimicrobiia bacterium]
MSLTIDSTDRRSDPSPEHPKTVERQPDEASPTVERWLDVMYGIRPNPAVRATFAPITSRYAGGIAEWLGRMWGIWGDQAPSAVTVDSWLETMWGIRPGRSFPVRSATVSFPYPEGTAEWLHRMWGLISIRVTTKTAAA